MADKKISALTAATLPLAGTEVLPIVQSSSTVKVATDDLTVKNIRSNATSGLLQVAGPGAATTRVMTTPDANFTAARTDAAQSFTGDQTLSTGNLIQGTAAKGVNFTANTPASGMTSQLLNWYEEGGWTPAFSSTGATFTYTQQYGSYVRVGKLIYAQFYLNVSVSGTTTNQVTITSLPFTSSTFNNPYEQGSGSAWSSNTQPVAFTVQPGATAVTLWRQNTGPTVATAADVAGYLVGTIIYRAA